MTKDYESSEEEFHRKIKCKRGKRGYPGFQGPPGPTGSSVDISYGEFISFQSQESQGGTNIVTFDTGTYVNGFELVPYFSGPGSIILINNPGLYFFEYELTFANESSSNSFVFVRIATSFEEEPIDLKIGTVTTGLGVPGFLNLSTSRYLNVTQPSFIFLLWSAQSPSVYLFGSEQQMSSAQISLTQISSAVPAPVTSRSLDLSTINLDSFKERFEQKVKAIVHPK